MKRPTPPIELHRENEAGLFTPAPEIVEWIQSVFLNVDHELYNEDHDHLRSASIKALWTNVPNVTKSVGVLASAEQPRPPATGGKWAREKYKAQMRWWFGYEAESIDFLLTFFAPEMKDLSDRSFCATIEHELYHCAQAVDEYGEPRFRQSDYSPIFTIKDHDFTGFLGVVKRYGAIERNQKEMVVLAKKIPEVNDFDISAACGICVAKAA